MQYLPSFNRTVIAHPLDGGVSNSSLSHPRDFFRVRRLSFFLALTCFLVFSACTPSQSTPALLALSTMPPVQPTQAQDDFFHSSGGGEPRSPGYWLQWNTCAEGNQSETARANGGRDSGWIILDDLLADPGILVGALPVESCAQGINLLQSRDLQGDARQDDAAYTLAAQLLAAQLNLALGSEYCPASDQAVSAAQLLLIGIEFTGTGSYLGPPLASPDVGAAQSLAEQLASYNTGALCR